MAVMIVQAHDIERICASIGHERTGNLLDDFFGRLRSIARGNDVIERIGDRKFAVVLNGLRNQGHVKLAARKIERVASATARDHDGKPNLTTTVGIALCPSQGTDGLELLRRAEIATLDGRRSNRNICFYQESSAQQMFVDWGLELRLEKALEVNQLELYYQPKINLATGAIQGAEALMRWHEPDIGSISPEVFISLAEATGKIFDLTNFAVQSSCRRIANWGSSLKNIQVAVNVTPSIIQSLEMVDVVNSATNIWSVPASRITIEVTENALMQDRTTSHAVLTELRELGFKISIDDFGTGYSSLAYLKEIPADEIKIDRSFVMGMLENSGDFKIVKHTIDIARSFGLSVVAEGVEDSTILETLRELGCDYAQGYYICKPVTEAEFVEFCKSHEVSNDSNG